MLLASLILTDWCAWVSGTSFSSHVKDSLAAEFLLKLMDVVGSGPVEVVAKTIADAVIIAELIATLWDSSANPEVSILIVIVTAVVNCLTFKNFDVSSEGS